MTELATGGKVWQVPEDATVSPVAPLSPKEKRLFRRNNKSGPQLLFGFLLPLGLLPTIAYFLMHSQMVKDDAARVPPVNLGDGYYSDGLLWSPATMVVVVVYVVALLSVLGCVVRYVRALHMLSTKWALAIGLSFMALFIFPSTLPIIMPTSEIQESFSTWAKDKYDLSSIEQYSTGKTSLSVTKESGEKTTMNVFAQDKFLYLYESNAELTALLEKIEGDRAG